MQQIIENLFLLVLCMTIGLAYGAVTAVVADPGLGVLAGFVGTLASGAISFIGITRSN